MWLMQLNALCGLKQLWVVCEFGAQFILFTFTTNYNSVIVNSPRHLDQMTIALAQMTNLLR